MLHQSHKYILYLLMEPELCFESLTLSYFLNRLETYEHFLCICFLPIHILQTDTDIWKTSPQEN